MRRGKTQSASLFMMELILAILIFSLASALCVQFFVKAHTLSGDAKALDFGCEATGSVADVIRSSDSLKDAENTFDELYPSALVEAEDNGVVISLYYDGEFENCDPEDAAYTLETALSDSGEMLLGDMTFTDTDSGSSIYTLEVKHHIRRDAHE